ncbi:MAG: methyltransferase domain-containing protein [Candidatus Aminicenantes bacterium]|nr:methyltransferase domain-containing protein [Candidatus Aminicenantes bacterium]
MSKEGWDEVYRMHKLHEIPWHSSQPDRNLVTLIRENKIKKGSVLDMCSGDGTNSIYLASKGFKVVGVDISPKAVEIAKERCKKRNVVCDYSVGDILKIKPDKKYDFIFDRGCFHHISDKNKTKYARLVNRLLKKKGKFFLLCFSDRNPPFAKNLSKKDIIGYFSDYFNILFIKDSVHKEPDTENKRYLYAVFMERKK